MEKARKSKRKGNLSIVMEFLILFDITFKRTVQSFILVK